MDSTPAGTGEDEAGAFPAASSLLDLLGGARQYLAFTFYIKTDKLHHTYYGAMAEEAELVPYFKLVTLMDPNYVSAYYVGAGIMDALGKREEAIAFTLQGIEANPESADLYYSLGDFYLEEKRYRGGQGGIRGGPEVRAGVSEPQHAAHRPRRFLFRSGRRGGTAPSPHGQGHLQPGPPVR